MFLFPFEGHSLQASDQQLNRITLNACVTKKITGLDVTVNGGAHLINVVRVVLPYFQSSMMSTGAVTSFNRQQL